MSMVLKGINSLKSIAMKGKTCHFHKGGYHFWYYSLQHVGKYENQISKN